MRRLPAMAERLCTINVTSGGTGLGKSLRRGYRDDSVQRESQWFEPSELHPLHQLRGGSGGCIQLWSISIRRSAVRIIEPSKHSSGSAEADRPTITASVNTGVTVSAPAIIATDCLGGPGTGVDVGFYNKGGILGSSGTNVISITAGSFGTGSMKPVFEQIPAP